MTESLNMNQRLVKLIKMAMLCAISLVLVMFIRIPFPPAPFLVYDPANIPILIGAFAFGPLAGLAITLVVSFVQAFILGGDGIIGFTMHFIATGAFAVVAGLIYKKHKTRKTAIIALVCGSITMTISMVALNLILTPIFMGQSMEVVIAMLIPIIIPFNLLKAGVNSVITFITYKAIAKYLHK